MNDVRIVRTSSNGSSKRRWATEKAARFVAELTANPADIYKCDEMRILARHTKGRIVWLERSGVIAATATRTTSPWPR